MKKKMFLNLCSALVEMAYKVCHLGHSSRDCMRMSAESAKFLWATLPLALDHSPPRILQVEKNELWIWIGSAINHILSLTSSIKVVNWQEKHRNMRLMSDDDWVDYDDDGIVLFHLNQTLLTEFNALASVFVVRVHCTGHGVLHETFPSCWKFEEKKWSSLTKHAR